MQKSGASFTVLFQDPFWVGIYQRWHEGQLEVSKIVFGAEPKDSEVLARRWKRLKKPRGMAIPSSCSGKSSGSWLPAGWEQNHSKRFSFSAK